MKMIDFFGRTKLHIIYSIAICFIYTGALIINGNYYIDDFGRSLDGYTAWTMNGRPVAEILMLAISFGEPLADISPLPQLLGVIFISLSIAIIGQKTLSDRPFLACLSLAPIITSPFILSNLSYKYDAATMGLSILLSTIPACLSFKKQKTDIAISTILLIMVLCLYQPAINAFIIISITVFVIECNVKERDLKSLIAKALSCILSLILYNYIIAKHTIKNHYNTQGSQILGANEIIDGICKNISTFNIFMHDIMTAPMIAISLTSLVISITFIIIKIKHNNKVSRSTLSSIILIFSIPSIMLMIYGPLLLLKNPVYHPRVLIGFGFALSSLLLISATLLKSFKYSALLFFIPYIYMYGLCSAYVNVQEKQKFLEEWVSMDISGDLFYNKDNVDSLMVFGSPGFAPEAKIVFKKYPIIRRIMRILINGGDRWGEVQLRHYSVHLKYSDDNKRDYVEDKMCKEKQVSKRRFYTMTIIDRVAVIDFSNKCSR
ncbi:hypothetical protein F9Z78_14755 [Escherichia coli]|nr:hypothetical protein F9Z78_14755 [Escherichia coli]